MRKPGRKSTKPRYVRKRRNYRVARLPKVYTFQRSFRSALTITTSGVGATAGYSPTTNFTVALDDVPSPADFTNLFDQYRIKNASMNLIYRGGNVRTQEGSIGASPSPQLPTFFYINDKDDSTSLAIDEVLEHQRVRMKQMTNNKTMTRFSIPTYTLESVSDGTNFGNVPRKSPWIDTDNSNVEHGNLKLLVHGGPSTGTVDYDFDVIYKITIQGKGPR